MKSLRHWSALALLVCAGGLGASLQDGGGGGGQAVLEARVLELEERIHDLESYAKAQARAAGVLSAKLDQSEKDGFTYGINPASRVVLLEGLREVAATAQKDVPGLEVAPAVVPQPQPQPQR